MKDTNMIKLNWQPRGSVPSAEDYPLFYHFDSAGLVWCPHPTTCGHEHEYPWASVKVAPPDDKEAEAADPLASHYNARAIREAVIAASNAPSADAARRWFSDRFLEVIGGAK